jgi:hypothetical protein
VQTKRSFNDHLQSDSMEACLELTSLSLAALRGWVEAAPVGTQVVMNAPLIGLGGYAARAAEVEAMVEDELRDSPVFVCRL